MRARLPRTLLAAGLGWACLATTLPASTAWATDPMFASGTPAARQLTDAVAMRRTAKLQPTIRFSPAVLSYFVIAEGGARVTVSELKRAGLHGLMGSVSRVYDDGNNRQVDDDDVLQPGRIYAARFDRETLIDFRTLSISQADPSTAVAHETTASSAVYGYGGSPDDGTKVVVLYDSTYNTKRYKCWKDGKSGAWDGITDQAPGADNVKNAAVVRRGKTIYVKDEAGMSGQERLTVYAPAAPGQTRQAVSWTTSYNTQRSAFAINVPADAAIGDYQVVFGETRGNYATLYVVFDPSYANQALNAEEIKSYAYVDEDWQTAVADKDYLNHAFEGPQGTSVFGYRGDTTAESGADGGVFGQRMLEVAAHIHGAATKTTLDAALHAYVVMGERLYWTSGQGYYGNDNGVINTFDKMLLGSIKAPGGLQTRDELDVVAAEKAALGLGWTDRLPQSYIFAAGQCFNYGTNLTAMLRALGIPSRTPYTKGGAGWPGSFHVWAEAYLDQPAIHPTEEGWWKSSWYKFDANRQYNVTGTSQIAHMEGNIGPLVIDGYGDYLLNEYKKCNGISYRGGYSKNAAKCTDVGNGTHAAVLLKANTTASTANLSYDASQSSSPWGIQDLFVPYNGPSTAPTVNYVVSSHHGYALNDTQAGTDGGTAVIADNTKENDLPALQPGVIQRTIAAGHGFSIFRVPVNGRATVTIRMQEGADKARLLATFDRMIYSTGKRFELNSDAESSASGVLTVDGANKNQIYLWVENKFSHASPGVGQEVTWVSLLDDSGTGGNVNPTANFSFTTSGLTANFTDASSDSDGTIASRSWSFGDNTSSTATNPSKTYATAGTYDVTLTVTDNGGATHSISKSVVVSDTANVAPTAHFSFTTSGLTANFIDSSSDSDGSIASRSWNFGDSTTSTATNPSKTYTTAGTYTVELTVTDNGGATHSTSKAVTVVAPTGNVLQNGVAVTGLSAAVNTSLDYTLVVPAGASGLKFVTSGGTGDADLYVRFGSAPTTTSYDCKSDGSTNTETCSIPTAQAGTYHVKLHAYAAFSGVSLTGSYSSGTALQNGVAVTGLSAAKDQALHYTLAVPAGASALKFVTAGGSGDADLYVKFGSAPTTSSYDCKSDGSTTAETCNIPTAQAGTYHVLVQAYSAFSGVSLTGSYSTGGGGVQTYSNTTDYTISDNATVESPITVSGRSGNAPSNATVTVEIVHTYRGDLKLDLVAPDGSVYLLKNYNSSDSADNVNATYTVNVSSEPLNGSWKLRVTDNTVNDVGYINRWSVTF